MSGYIGTFLSSQQYRYNESLLYPSIGSNADTADYHYNEL